MNCTAKLHILLTYIRSRSQ